MAKITLEDYLKKHGDLSREMMGCSKLIDKLEIWVCQHLQGSRYF